MSSRAAPSPVARRTGTQTSSSRPRISGRGAALLFVAMLAAMLSIAPMRAFLQQREQLRRLEAQAAGLGRVNDGLHAQIERLRDHVYLERLARECLGMVRPGEIAFVTVPTHGAPVQPDC